MLTPEEKKEMFLAREAAKQPIEIITSPDLFSTPHALASEMVDCAFMLGRNSGWRSLVNGEPMRVLEPSAGTGNLANAFRAHVVQLDRPPAYDLTLLELNRRLCDQLALGFPKAVVACCDFLTIHDPPLLYDMILMNPPFGQAVDIKHIRRAVTLLRSGGILVALCANGPRQRRSYNLLCESYQADYAFYRDLPAGSFKTQGTMVNVAMMGLVIK